MATGDNCEATIGTKGFTFSGTSGAVDCSGAGDTAGVSIEGVKDIRLGSGLYFEDYSTGVCCSGNYVTIGAAAQLLVSGSGCSGDAVRGAAITGINWDTGDFCISTGDACDLHVKTKGFTFSGTSGNLDCSGSGVTTGVVISDVKDIRLGSGLYFQDYSTVTGSGVCCSGNYVTLAATALLKVSGHDCSGNEQVNNLQTLNLHSGDFCVTTGDLCDATIRTKGFTVVGSSDTDCLITVELPAWDKDIWYSPGDRVKYSGICYEQVDSLGAKNKGDDPYYHSLPINQDAASMFWQSIPCEGTVSSSPSTFQGVKNITFADGLTVEGTSGICCSGNEVIVRANVGTISGMDCSGTGYEFTPTKTIYDSDDFCVNIPSGTGSSGCEAVIKTKGFTFSGTSGAVDCSGSGDTAGVSIEGVKDIRLGSGLYFEDYSTGVCCSGNYVTLAATALLKVSGHDCSGNEQVNNLQTLNLNPTDFCVATGDNCEATIGTKGITVEGSTTEECVITLEFPEWDASTTYQYGDRVKYSGVCYQQVDFLKAPNQGDDPINHSLPVAQDKGLLFLGIH